MYFFKSQFRSPLWECRLFLWVVLSTILKYGCHGNFLTQDFGICRVYLYPIPENRLTSIIGLENSADSRLPNKYGEEFV